MFIWHPVNRLNHLDIYIPLLILHLDIDRYRADADEFDLLPMV